MVAAGTVRYLPRLIAALSLGFILTGCSSITSPVKSATTTGNPTVPTVPSTTPRSPADSAGRAAIAAYLGMWQDFAKAGTTSDWQSPTLAQYATGIALSNMSRGLYADHYNGLITKGNATHDARVSSVDPASNPTTVVVTDCSDSTHAQKYQASNGQPANDSPGGRRLINAIVQKQSDGGWMVSDFGVQAVGTC
jgi:hypothetical protein